MKHTPHTINILTRTLRRLLPLWLLSLAMGTSAQLQKKFTKERPLIIICDWELPPYEFSSDSGQPDGFNVDLLKAILDKMDLPYKFIMKESFLVNETFEQHKADLTIDHTAHYRAVPHYFVSRNIPLYYKTKVAVNSQADRPDSIHQFSNNCTIILKTHDKATQSMLKQIAPEATAKNMSVNEALVNVANHTDCYFVWGEEPIKWFLKEMNLTGISIADYMFPVTEIHIVGHDKQLIDEIDDQYARLEQSGAIERLRDKWFHPERIHDNTSPVAIFATIGFLLLAVVLFLLNRLAKRRAISATCKTQEMESMMLKALSMTQYSIIVFNTKTQMFTNRHGYVIPKEGVSHTELIKHIHPDNQEAVRNSFFDLLNERTDIVDLDMRWLPFDLEGKPAPDTDNPWQFIRGHAIIEKDASNHVQHIVCTIKNVNKEMLEQRSNNELGSRYTNIFDTSMIAMSFYDKNGMLLDLNQKMRELCAFDHVEKYFRETNLFDNPYFRDDLDPNLQEQFHVCQHMYYPENGLDKYLELRISPTADDSGQLAYYTITARDVTDERTIHMEQRRHDKELQKINNQINAYENQLQYLLKQCDMYVWEFDLQTHHINFSRSLSKVEFSASWEEYLGWMVEDERQEADRLLRDIIMNGKDYNTIHHFTHTAANDAPCWYAMSGIPLNNGNKQMTGYFGVVRDITKLMDAQEQLRRERKRADESGKLKSVFLANMTHEIRTPLNAIVGFSDLLQMIDDPSERHEFIRIIHNNCDMLLRLINDIIEASSINQGPLAIEEKEVDFALAFNDICQTLSQRVQEPGVQFLVDNPYQSFVTCLDKGRMQQVITNFTTNAVKYTHEGHIRVGYRYISEEDTGCQLPSDVQASTPRKGIYLYCEDTGAGIPKEKQASVFDRFVKLNDYVQGTGLGLSICKSIAEQCKGHIGVNSEGEGHGSTFWIWIPCELKKGIALG